MIETKLESLENIFGNVEKATNITIQKEMKLDSNDLSRIVRAYMEVKVVLTKNAVEEEMVDWPATAENLTSSKHWNNILRPYTGLISHPGLFFSTWHSIVQIKEPRFACATSPFMLAAKHSQKVPFQFFKRGVPVQEWAYLFNYSVADSLACGVSSTEWNSCTPNEFLYQQVLRNPLNPLDHVLKRPENVKAESEDDDEDTPRYHWQEFKGWPRLIRHMKLQTWIFHPSVRDEDAMVLHPINWSFTPEPSRMVPVAGHSSSSPTKLGGGLLAKHLGRSNAPTSMLDSLMKRKKLPQDDLV